MGLPCDPVALVRATVGGLGAGHSRVRRVSLRYQYKSTEKIKGVYGPEDVCGVAIIDDDTRAGGTGTLLNCFRVVGFEDDGVEALTHELERARYGAVFTQVLGELDLCITGIEPCGVHSKAFGDGAALEGHTEEVLPCCGGGSDIVGADGDVVEADVTGCAGGEEGGFLKLDGDAAGDRCIDEIADAGRAGPGGIRRQHSATFLNLRSRRRYVFDAETYVV